jgi:TIR domain.
MICPVELKIGEKMLDSIENGMNKSKSCILLISKVYLDKGWNNYELDVFLRHYIEEKKKVFPIWLNVTKAELEKGMQA